MGDLVSVNSLSKFSLKSLNLQEKCPSVLVAPTGVKVTAFPFPRIKFSTDRKSRISILSDEVIVCKVHYDEELKSFFCTGGCCCELTGKEPSVRYCYPIVQYIEVSDLGKPLTTKVEVKLLQLSKAAYESICIVAESRGSLVGLDFIVNCEDATYQKCTYTEVGQSVWATDETQVSYVKEYLEKNLDRILSSIAKVLPDSKIKEVLGSSAGSECISAESLEDVFKI